MVRKIHEIKKGPITAVIGLRHGDEGKAKVVDFLLHQALKEGKPYRACARYQGGPNAGHTIWINGEKHVNHQNPSGGFVEGVALVTGTDVVFCPGQYMKEDGELLAKGIDIQKRTKISYLAPIRTPYHILLDHADEHKRSQGTGIIGTTKQGISWVYQDVAGRRQLTVRDLLDPKWEQIFDEKSVYWKQQLHMNSKFDGFHWNHADFNKSLEEWKDAVKRFRERFGKQAVSIPYYMNMLIKNGARVIAEGAQGHMLDVDYGDQPNVTSSHPGISGICSGLGVSDTAIGDKVGVFKAYDTKVGSGDFVTQITDQAVAKLIQDRGVEFGATSGRPRAVGWLNMPEMRYAIMMNTPTKMFMTKADVLDNLSQVGLVKRYAGSKKDFNQIDFALKNKPLVEYVTGWQSETSHVTDYTKLPQKFQDFCSVINNCLDTIQPGLKLNYIGTGCDRLDTIVL